MSSVSLVSLLLKYRYWILFPAAAIEGPVVAIIAGFFVSLGYLQPLPSYIILLFGDIIPDTFYYWLGHLSHQVNFLKRHGHRVGITENRLKTIEHLWQRHTFKSALLSKWAYGMSTPLLMSAGLARLSLKKFLLSVVSITIIQYGLLMIGGYYFGSSYQLLNTYIKDAGLVVAAVVVVLLAVYFLASRYAKRVLLRDT